MTTDKSSEDKNVVAIVQARTGSTRLPGKVLFDVAGHTLLERVVQRLRTATFPDQIVVATTESDPDAAVAWHADQLGVDTFRGSESNVLDRYYDAAMAYDADVIVRLTADNPLLAPDVVDTVIRTRSESGADYCSTEFDHTFPHGIGAEAFTMDSFKTVRECDSSAREREHVTPYYRSNSESFSVTSVTATDVYEQPRMSNRTDLRLTLDTPADYQFLTTLFESMEDGIQVPLSSAVKYIDDTNIVHPTNR